MFQKLFPPSTQHEIDLTMNTLEQMERGWRNAVTLYGNFNDPKTTIYDSYPYFFLKAFPTLDPAEVRPLSVSGRLFASSIVLYDKVMDSPFPAASSAASQVLSLQAMQYEGYRLLHRLFPPESAFWGRFHQYMVDHAEACVEEKRFASGERSWHEFTEETALRIAVGKNGVSRAAIAGLVELAHDESLFDSLTQSVNAFNIACQLWDDLCDWKQDLRSGTPTLLLSRLLGEKPAIAGANELSKLTKRLARELYYDGHVRSILELALQFLDRSEGLTSNIPDLAWRSIIEELRQRCRALHKDVDRIVGQNLRRVREQPEFNLDVPAALDEWQQVAWDALSFTVRQWRLGFGEARHIMFLPNAEGFAAEAEYHYGDTFQRALIADALCDANELLNGQLQPILDYETQYLLSRRQDSEPGGWTYFPAVPEIAPDADDLGQIMQLLLRAGCQREVAQYCVPPLEVLLRDNSRADGSIETWIIPARSRTANQERQLEFNRTKWGTGPDIDVMANLLYAMSLYEPLLYAETIERGATYLESQQQRDGSWASRWYYGPYYGTYVCTRLLALSLPCSSALKRAFMFLKESQHEDGGWGMEAGKSDPLSTALALLGLAAIQTSDAGTLAPESAARALKYLRRSLEKDGGWPCVPFIRPRLSEPYESRTMTTIYVMKAAIACHRLMINNSTDVCAPGIGAGLTGVALK